MICSCQHILCRFLRSVPIITVGNVVRIQRFSSSEFLWNPNSTRFGDRGKRSQSYKHSSETVEVPEQSFVWPPRENEKPITFRKEANQPDAKDLPPSMRKKYKFFTDESEEILDSAKSEWMEIEAPADEPAVDEFEGLNMERGLTGVLDIEDLMHVLRLENAIDICVIQVPPEMRYTEYLVIASGRSGRQLLGMAEFVRRYYKKKRLPTDPLLDNTLGISKWKQDWVALDLGNIVLHLMDRTTRTKYDIESLWTVGPQYDTLCRTKKDPILQLVEQHSRLAGTSDGTVPARKIPLARLLR